MQAQDELMAATSIYWISTTLLSLLYLSSAFLYLAKSDWVRKALGELGYPGYLVRFMIVVKLLGPLAILARFNVALSDLAHAGTFFHLILSGMAHLGVHKPKGAIPAALGLILLLASFMTQNAGRELQAPYAPAPASIQTLFN